MCRRKGNSRRGNPAGFGCWRVLQFSFVWRGVHMEPSEKPMKAAWVGNGSDPDHRAARGSLRKIPPLYAMSFLILATVVVGFIWHDLRGGYLDTLAYWNVQLSGSANDLVRITALWLNERRTDTSALAGSSATIRLLTEGGSKSALAEVPQAVERRIAHLTSVNGFLGGAVADRDCRIVAQSGTRPEMAQGIQEACQAVLRAGEYRVDTFGMEQDKVWLSLSAPVMAESQASPAAPTTRRMVGSVVMVAENWQDIVPTFAAVSVPKRASETFVVWKKAREAFIFSPRLSARGVPALFRRPLDGGSFESRVALGGDVAFGEFLDYRGQPIFGVARRIGVPGYSLAREVNRDEALSEYYRHRVLDGLVGTLSLLLLGSLLVAQHRHAAARDSEERVRQEEAVRERDRRYRVLFESAGDGILLMRGDHFVDCNQKALELFGCEREQLIGNTPYALSPPKQPDGADSQEAARERIRRALEGQALQFEWQHLRRDGTPVDAQVTLSCLEIAGEAHLLALVRDVTEQKRAEQALQASEARFRNVMEKAPVAISISRVGRTLYVNQRYLEMYGFQSVDEVVGHSVGEQWAPECRPMIEERARQRALGLPVPSQYEAVGQRRDGSEFPVEIVVAPVVLPDGEASIGFLMDITERQRTQEERQRSLDQLRALAARLQSIREEERKRVAREIHDQLGQALTAIKIDLSSLARELPAGGDQQSERISSILKLVDESIRVVRRISTELRPGMADPRVQWCGRGERVTAPPVPIRWFLRLLEFEDGDYGGREQGDSVTVASTLRDDEDPCAVGDRHICRLAPLSNRKLPTANAV